MTGHRPLRNCDIEPEVVYLQKGYPSNTVVVRRGGKSLIVSPKKMIMMVNQGENVGVPLVRMTPIERTNLVEAVKREMLRSLDQKHPFRLIEYVISEVGNTECVGIMGFEHVELANYLR